MKPSVMWLAASITCGSLPAAVLASEIADRKPNIQEIIAALEDKDMSANEIRTTETYIRLDVVDLSAVKSSGDSQALEDALAQTEDGWAMVQTAIVANDLIKQELRRRSVALRRIVAATMDDNGVITIYTR